MVGGRHRPRAVHCRDQSRHAAGADRANRVRRRAFAVPAGAEVCLAKVGDAPTIIFDEVDSGIGGATAAAVGVRLKRLAKDVQVLVVTHSPQVAAVADRHWLIRKTTTRNTASTDVVALDAKGRREEIARMLAGAEVTAEARAAADKLLATA